MRTSAVVASVLLSSGLAVSGAAGAASGWLNELWPGLWWSGLVCQPPAESAPAEPAVNNLVHPPGTVTAALGTLGHVEKLGRGPVPVILLPGAGFEWDSWKPFMERNAASYTMYAVTPAGYGSTAPPPMPENPEDFTGTPWTDGLIDGVASLIRDEKLDRPIVIGHHLLGGYYALRVALDHPELTRGAVVAAGEIMRPADPPRAQAGGGAVQQAASPADATPDEQLAAVHRRWVPFFRGVSASTFRANQYPASALCRDAERAAALHQQETGQPVPVQIRYFLEFNRTNILPDMAGLRVPVMAVQPKRSFEAIIDRIAAGMGGGDAAREQAKAALVASMGSEEAARANIERDGLWERAASASHGVSVRYVADTRIFVMEDQPEQFDSLVAEFVAGLK